MDRNLILILNKVSKAKEDMRVNERETKEGRQGNTGEIKIIKK